MLRVFRTAMLAALLFAPSLAFAQTPPGVNTIYNVDHGAVLTNTALGAGTVNSADQINYASQGATCTLNVSTEGGEATVTWGLQIKDAASGAYTTVLSHVLDLRQSLQSTGFARDILQIHPAIQTTSLPSATGVSMEALNLDLGSVWRVTELVGGTSTPTVTGTIGCVEIQ